MSVVGVAGGAGMRPLVRLRPATCWFRFLGRGTFAPVSASGHSRRSTTGAVLATPHPTVGSSDRPGNLHHTEVTMAAMKVDFKRELRAFYSTGREPVMVDVPELAFLMIDGHGDPNTAAEYSEAVQALYAVAYAAKFAVKRASGDMDYGVMPLEGLWWVPDMSTFTIEDKSA